MSIHTAAQATASADPEPIEAESLEATSVESGTAEAVASIARTPAPAPYDAILFASFGGPEGQDDVLPFLRNVTRGRGIPDERLEEVAGHYRALGGRSPINDQNRAMIAALEKELEGRLIDLPVYWGNRNWEPYTGDAIASLHADGHRRVLALVTSAYSSYSGCRQYREDFALGLEQHGLFGEVTIDKVPSYFDQRGFLEPVADGVRTAIAELRAEGHAPEHIEILFSTHSIPLTMSRTSGPPMSGSTDPQVAEGGWYVAQHLTACRWVIEQLAADDDDAASADVVDAETTAVPSWQLVYQSRSGAPHIPWLEPDINDVIGTLAADGGKTAVIVVPIGFVTDHVEVIWDLDTEAKETAAEHHLGFRRVATSGTDPRFIAMLADLIEQHLVPGATRVPAVGCGVPVGTCGRTCCQAARSADARPDPTAQSLEDIAAGLRAVTAARAAAASEARPA